MPEVDVDAISEHAVAMADVEEPDLEPFRSNLEMLVDCINSEAHLTREVTRLCGLPPAALRSERARSR